MDLSAPVPTLCPRNAFLPLLACLAQRRISNLRGINNRLKYDPPPGTNKMNYLVNHAL